MYVGTSFMYCLWTSQAPVKTRESLNRVILTVRWKRPSKCMDCLSDICIGRRESPSALSIFAITQFGFCDRARSRIVIIEREKKTCPHLLSGFTASYVRRPSEYIGHSWMPTL